MGIEILWSVAKDMTRADGVPVRMPRLLGSPLAPTAAARALPLEVAMLVKGCALFRGLSNRLTRWVRFLVS